MSRLFLYFLAGIILANPSYAIQKNGTINLSDSEKVKVYDKYGSYQGKYVQNGNKTKAYDKTGSYQGYSVQNGNKTKYYNKYGQYDGYSKNN